ncbi:MAG: glycosyltransferase [Dialister invisus]
MADKLKAAGVRTFFVPVRQSRFLSVWRVSSIVKKYHIDVIHANSGAAGIIAARVKRNTSVPVVYTAHGILGNMEKEYVIDQLDQIICVSEYVRQDSIARGFHEDHLLVRYSGIDTERFTANEEERIRLRKEFGFDKDTLVLAIVSRIKIWNIKATDIFSPYWTSVAVKKTGSSLSSEKERAPLLKTKIRTMHLSDKVLCLGHRTDVEHLLNAADLTVLPSRFETFGLVLAEGMAMGKPAIAFSVGGTPEIVKDGETGFLVEKDNEKELYERIKQLDNYRSLLRQFSENGVRWIRSQFTNRRMVDELEVIYHKLSP